MFNSGTLYNRCRTVTGCLREESQIVRCPTVSTESTLLAAKIDVVGKSHLLTSIAAQSRDHIFEKTELF